MQILLEKSKYHRFSFYFDYNQEKVDFCRSLKDSFGWERFAFEVLGGLKRWVFSESFFVTLIKERFPEVSIEEGVFEVVEEDLIKKRANERKEKRVEKVKDSSTTKFDVKGLKKALYDYQKIGVEFFKESEGRAINADQMGCGKTIQALAYIKYSGFTRSLIVCPASVKFSWENEVKKWTNLSFVVIDSKTELASIDKNIQIWIINYDILRKHYAQLSKIHFDNITGDESQYLKSTSAARTKVFRALSREIKSVILLSGTPLLSRPEELFSLLNIIDPASWQNWFSYAKRYCAMKQTRWGLNTSGASNIEELHAKIKRYFIRRNKEDVLKELPPKNFIEIPVRLANPAKEQYTVAANNLAEYLRSYAGKKTEEIRKSLSAEKLTRLNVLRQISSLGKIATVKELVESVINAGEKVLVFCSFVEPLEELQKIFPKNSVIITGKTPMQERKSAVEAFQNNDKVNVFLGGYKSAGVGLTLTAAQNFIGMDFPWNPADLQQAMDRCHRPGQEASCVNIYQIKAQGTIDEDMKEVIDKKQGIFDQIIDGKTAKSVSSTAMEAAVDRVLKNY